MRFLQSIPILVIGLALAGPPAYATGSDSDKASKQQEGSETKTQKQEHKQKRSDTGPQGEEQTGGAAALFATGMVLFLAVMVLNSVAGLARGRRGPPRAP